jgi:hypothetical protein
MCDPVAWLWSFADFDEPVFDETSLRIVLGESVDRLMSLNFFVRTSDAEFVSCPSCIDGHKEEVVVLDFPDGTRRYFVPCPEYLRVEVPREMLEQWTINWNALASAVAAVLSLGGICTPLVDGRLWRLGRTKWQGQSRNVLLARGLTWADGAEVASQAARSTRPIVFVGDRLPPTGVWPGRVPPVVALSQFATLGESGLVVDHDAVLAAILDADAMVPSASQEPVTTDQLTLMIRRQIKAEGKTQLADDILVAAYQQEGSVRKAAAFLSERTGQTVTKDKVQQALNRSGGVGAVVRRPSPSGKTRRH